MKRKKKESYDTKYTTENMGEVIVTDIGPFAWVNGKYNSEDVQLASTGLVSFKENFNYIMNLVNQYREIHKITKKAIIENFDNNKNIRDFFYHFDSLGEEKLFEFLGIRTFGEFDIYKAVDRLKYPRLYFEGGLGKIELAVQYWMSYDYPIILDIAMDENLNIECFMID